MKNLLLKTIPLFLLSTHLHAGFLIQGATVTLVANTSQNSNNFAIHTAGGTGPCASATQIIFPLSAAPSEAVHTKAYSTALTALTAGLKVSIYNYSSDLCDGAVNISISK